MTALSDRRQRNGVRTALQFAVAGPFVGGIVSLILAALSVDAPQTPLRVLAAVGASVPYYPFSLFAGFIPAMVTGTLYAAVLQAGWVSAENYKARCAFAAAIGGALSALFLTGFGVTDGLGQLSQDAIHGFLSGAVAGGACALVFPASPPKAAI